MPRFLLAPRESKKVLEGRMLSRGSWTASQPETSVGTTPWLRSRGTGVGWGQHGCLCSLYKSQVGKDQ